jgi:uncharacterized protein (DUF488 family)
VRPQSLYTFGYEGLDLETFIARLVAVGVRSVIDVRELPLSRKKGFSKTGFAQRLEMAGIAYFHAPTLGCPKAIRDQYRKDGDWVVYTRSFAAYMKTQKAKIEELAEVAWSSAVCLVCFEADPATCHRTYVARAAHAAGAPPITHLTAETSLADQPLRRAA